MAVIQDLYGLTKLRVIAVGMLLNSSSLLTYARGSSALFLADASANASQGYNINGTLPVNYVIRPDGKVYNGAAGFNETTIKSWIDACVGVEEGAVTTTPAMVFSPNPIKTTTAINVTGIESGSLQIHDLSGRVVKSFSLNSNSTLNWNRTDDKGKVLPKGMYFCKLTAGEVKLTQKITILE